VPDDPDGVDGPFDGVEESSVDVGTEYDPGSGVSSSSETGLWYPTVDDVVEVHDEIIAEDPDADPGVRDRDRIQYALDHVEGRPYGGGPETVHEKAFALLRLIASNHWFVDGNKRTALNVTNLFYLLNGYELQYGDELRAMLKLLAVRESRVDRETAAEYLADQTVELDEETIWALGLAALGAVLAEELDVDLSELDIGTDSLDGGSR